MPVCCEVALPVPLDRVFTYAGGEGQLPLRGARVVVPFKTEKLIGVVTAVGVPAPKDVDLRALEAVLDDEPLLSEQLLSLAEWMAQYYLAPLGEVLRGMLPLMAEVRRTVYYRITDLGRDELADCLEGKPGSSHPFADETGEWMGHGAFETGKRPPVSKRRGKLSAEEQDLEHRVMLKLAN